jgi:hypothetical protein
LFVIRPATAGRLLSQRAVCSIVDPSDLAR